MSKKQLQEQKMIEVKALFRLKGNVDIPRVIDGPLGNWTHQK